LAVVGFVQDFSVAPVVAGVVRAVGAVYVVVASGVVAGIGVVVVLCRICW